MVLAPPIPLAKPETVPSPDDDRARSLGLPSATALVIGSIIGTGVFTMPGVLAGAGTSSILVLGVIAVGAVLLGVMFGQLTKRIPSSDGGLYAYSRHEFGDFADYLTTSPTISRPGVTGSPHGQATPRSCRRGCSTSSHSFPSPIPRHGRIWASPYWDCGFPRR